MSYFRERLAHYAWDIAFGTYSDTIITNGLSGINVKVVKNPYKNKWFADPFILEATENTIQFLVEEFDDKVGRGRIARLKVNKSNCRIEECSIILDLPTHLSFPVIYRVNGCIYVHPENSASGSSFIYRYDSVIDKLVDPKLMVEEPITDAVIRKNGDVYRMFATRLPDSNGCILHEYNSDNLFGPYIHVGEEIFNQNTARMAGMFLTLSDDMVIRPAQDCFGGYGKAIVMYNGHLPVCRIEPSSYKYSGIHTFNSYNGEFVIDYKKYDYPLIYKLTRLVKL